jgi:ribosomal-protein-alanine N-acetyltransferase
MRETTLALAPSRIATATAVSLETRPPIADWRSGLPVLSGGRVTLRELRVEDGNALLPLITAPEVVRFMSPTPETPNWFANFITSTSRQRQAGRYAGFAVVPHGHDRPVGLVQLRQLDPGFSTAEWGIALGSDWWGRGLFEDAGRLVLAFAFDTLGVHRLEARVASQNARGNAAVVKLGAVAEGLLRRSLRTSEGELDQVLWSWLEDDWRRDEARRVAEELVWVH